MTQEEAQSLIRSGIAPGAEVWADLGAGTGVFTLALQELLPRGRVYALDKSPHMLWRLPRREGVELVVTEGDFTRPFELPEPLDGILMANALHYAPDPLDAMGFILPHLKKGGLFILIEYDTDRPNPPWVPYPVSLKRFRALAEALGLSAPELLGRRASVYGSEEIYGVVCKSGLGELS
ncbi:MAG: class I SAM-dependent methyltransferase [Bacteroidetes bacterium]|nr:MAG: class I SAM-dependent methyltransferase [Bacteroidota bacterium]